MMSLGELQSLINAPTLSANDLMRCALGIKTAEVEVYCALFGLGKTTVKEIAHRLKRSRPTTQKLLQALVEKGLATRNEELIGLGGYRFIYQAVPPEKLKISIKDMIDKWYYKMVEELNDLPFKIQKMGCRR